MPPAERAVLDPLTFNGKHWCFTLNNPTTLVITDFIPARHITYAIWQHEQGGADDNDGTPHLQGYVAFVAAKRLTALKRFSPEAHWEPTRDIAASHDYCSKEDTRLPDGGPWEVGQWQGGVTQGKRTDLDRAVEALKNGGLKRVAQEHPVAYVKYANGLRALERQLYEPPKNDTFVARPWQQRLLDIFQQHPDDRSIHWVTDVAGKAGKSKLAKFLVTNHGALLVQGRNLDMAHAYHSQRIVIFDVPRTSAENMAHLYGFAEQLKNGMLFSSKYDSEMKSFDPPHVLFLCNFSYDRAAWTDDRAVEFDSSDPGFNAYVAAVPAAVAPAVIELPDDLDVVPLVLAQAPPIIDLSQDDELDLPPECFM